MKGPHQDIDFLERIVKRQGSTDGFFHAEPPQSGLRAVMTGPSGDSLPVQVLGDFFRFETGDDKGKNAGLVRGRPDEAQTASVAYTRSSCS